MTNEQKWEQLQRAKHREMLEARMLSGEPFTYGGLCAAFGDDVGEARSRLIDSTIQRLRRSGKITYRREGGAVTWRPGAPPTDAEPSGYCRLGDDDCVCIFDRGRGGCEQWDGPPEIAEPSAAVKP